MTVKNCEPQFPYTVEWFIDERQSLVVILFDSKGYQKQNPLCNFIFTRDELSSKATLSNPRTLFPVQKKEA